MDINALIKKYSEILSPVSKGLSQVGNAVGQAATQAFNANPTVQNIRTIQQVAPVIAQKATPAIQNFYDRAVNPRKYMTPQQQASQDKFINSYVQNTNKNIANNPFANNPISRSVNDYAINQFVKPAVEGSRKLIKKDLSGALDLLGPTFQSLPGSQIPMIGFNALGGSAAGALRSARTGENLQQSVYKGATQPTSIGAQGLGIQNPLLALGVDLLAGNPKDTVKLFKGSKNVANIVRNLKENSSTVEDAAYLDKAVELIRGKIGTPEQTVQAKDVIYKLAERYLKKDERPDNVNVNIIIKNLQKKFKDIGSYSNSDFVNNFVGKQKATQSMPTQPKVSKTQLKVKPTGEPVMTPEEQAIYDKGVKLFGEPGAPLKTEAPQYNEASLWNPDTAEIPSKTKPFTSIGTDQAKSKTAQAEYMAGDQKPMFDRIFARFIGERDSAKTKGVQVGQKLTKLPEGVTGPDVIKAIENPEKATPQMKKYLSEYRQIDDELFANAKNSGLDINYLKNHIGHIWKESEQQVAQAYSVFKKKYGFANSRQIPTYEEGIKMGLTPKYNSPAQIVAEQVRKLEETKAGIKAFEELKNNGFIVPASVGIKQPGFISINAPGFPMSSTRIDGQTTIVGRWYAPKDIAQKFDRVFAPQDFGIVGDALSRGRKISGAIQDITLSGGVPGTPINAFALANAQKEMTAGRFTSPVKAMVRSMIPGATKNFFEQNSGQLIKMQERNIPVHTNWNTESLANDGALKSLFSDGARGAVSKSWNKLVNDPTFNKFMPMLHVQMFNDVENAALKSGKSPEVAADIAAKAVKNFYGITGSDKTATRLKAVEDFKGTFLFAPKYRESMIHFWINNVKALKNPLAPENVNNVRFVIGAAATLGAMEALNRHFNDGRSMVDNPNGTEDKLLIPVSKITGNSEDKDVIGIPFLSSIATIPRAMFREGLMALRGDIKGALLDAGQSYLSSGIKPIFDVAKNSDYFGKDIVADNMNPDEKFGAIIKYLGGQYLSHPYLKELLDPRNQADPAYQRLSRAMELPLRFYTQKSLEAKDYFAARDTAIKGLSQTEQGALNSIPKFDSNDPNTTIHKYQTYLTYPNVFKAKQQIELETAKKTGKAIDPLYLVDYNTAKQYMRYETLPPGSQDRKDMVKASPELQALFEIRSKYFDENPISLASNKTTGIPRPVASAYAQQQMNAKNWKDPEVQAYLNATTAYNNQQREKLGLPPIAGYTPFAKKPKKLKVTAKMTKIPKIKVKKISYKMPKVKKIKQYKLKTVKRLT